MWITNDLPSNKPSDFGRVGSFDALVLLDHTKAKNACELIRQAEGPRHIDIILSRPELGTDGRNRLKNFLKELQQGLENLAPELNSEEFDPGFFLLDAEENAKSNPKAKGKSTKSGSFNEIPKRKPTGHVGENPGKRTPAKNEFSRQGDPFDAKYALVRNGKTINIRAVAKERADAAEVRLVIANGSDETCDKPDPDQYLAIGRGVAVNQILISDAQYRISGSQETCAFVFGPIEADANFDFEIPVADGVEDLDIRVEFVKRGKLTKSEVEL